MPSIHDLTQKTFIIAEIGKGFIQTEEEQPVSVYLENAKELVRLAKEAGADAVKFQTHVVEDEQLNINVTSPHFKGSDRFAWVSRNERSTPLEGFWKPLQAYCNELNILFFSTPMSRKAAQLLESINVPLWKVGSGDILDFVTLDYLASTKKPIIFSSGMSTLEETDKAVQFLKERNADVALLHCISKYPCPPEELNLSTIPFFQDRYDMPIGFSDHSIGHESAVAAVALGAKIIEKHFSTSREHWGSDHKASLLPEEFATLVREIRALENNPMLKLMIMQKDSVVKGLGQHTKSLADDEAVFRQYFRKAVMAGQDIPTGTTITKEMLYAMRPQAFAKGFPSEQYENILGKTTTKPLKKYDPINEECL